MTKETAGFKDCPRCGSPIEREQRGSQQGYGSTLKQPAFFIQCTNVSSIENLEGCGWHVHHCGGRKATKPTHTHSIQMEHHLDNGYGWCDGCSVKLFS